MNFEQLIWLGFLIPLVAGVIGAISWTIDRAMNRGKNVPE